MKTQHTPGQWKFTISETNPEILIYAEQGTNKRNRSYKNIARLKIPPIQFRKAIDESEQEKFDEAEANAKLIAAAPKLLEELISLSHKTPAFCKIQWTIEDQKRIIDLIKKATE